MTIERVIEGTRLNYPASRRSASSREDDIFERSMLGSPDRAVTSVVRLAPLSITIGIDPPLTRRPRCARSSPLHRESRMAGLPLSVLYLSPVPEGGAGVDALRQ